MSISQFLEEAIKWLAWCGLALFLAALISFLMRWGIRFRLVGATIFSFLLAGSCWAFQQSYTPPVTFEGAIYAPVVYDNGSDLVVAQAPEDFPEEAIKPSLQQIAKNLKGGGRNGAKVTIRLRKVKSLAPGISKPVIIGELTRDSAQKITIRTEVDQLNITEREESKEETTTENKEVVEQKNEQVDILMNNDNDYIEKPFIENNSLETRNLDFNN